MFETLPDDTRHDKTRRDEAEVERETETERDKERRRETKLGETQLR